MSYGDHAPYPLTYVATGVDPAQHLANYERGILRMLEIRCHHRIVTRRMFENDELAQLAGRAASPGLLGKSCDVFLP